MTTLIRADSSISLGPFELAEGPHWDSKRSLLYWVDISKGMVLSGQLDDVGDILKAKVIYKSSSTVGCVVPTNTGGLLVANGLDVIQIDRDGNVNRTFPTGLTRTRARRLNDGTCDPAGRFLIGSLSLDGSCQTESLLRLEEDGSFSTIDDDLTISNGLGWSPDGRTFYSVDSAPGTIWARDYDPESGRIGKRHLHIAFDIREGVPDGIAIDIGGNMWTAVYGGSKLACFDSAGIRIAEISVPTELVTSVEFVGESTSQLIVTSAQNSNSVPQENQSGGRIFRLAGEMEIPGILATDWVDISTLSAKQTSL